MEPQPSHSPTRHFLDDEVAETNTNAEDLDLASWIEGDTVDDGREIEETFSPSSASAEEAEDTSDRPVVSNVKAHFRVKCLVLDPDSDFGKQLRRCGNFFIYKYSDSSGLKLSFTYWPKGGTVNVAGIKSLDRVGEAVHVFEREAKCLCVKGSIKVDNTMASGRFLKRGALNLDQVVKAGKDRLFAVPCVVAKRAHYFPAAYIRPRFSRRGGWNSLPVGTVNLFANYKYTVTGCKDQAAIDRTYGSVKLGLQRAGLLPQPVWRPTAAQVPQTPSPPPPPPLKMEKEEEEEEEEEGEGRRRKRRHRSRSGQCGERWRTGTRRLS